MKRSDAVMWLRRKGYTIGRGRMFYHPTRPGRRYVANERVLRFEIYTNNQWAMIRHGYYGEMCLTPQDKLASFKPFTL